MHPRYTHTYLLVENVRIFLDIVRQNVRCCSDHERIVATNWPCCKSGYLCVCVCVCVYVQSERRREGEREGEKGYSAPADITEDRLQQLIAERPHHRG